MSGELFFLPKNLKAKRLATFASMRKYIKALLVVLYSTLKPKVFWLSQGQIEMFALRCRLRDEYFLRM